MQQLFTNKDRSHLEPLASKIRKKKIKITIMKQNVLIEYKSIFLSATLAVSTAIICYIFFIKTPDKLNLNNNKKNQVVSYNTQTSLNNNPRLQSFKTFNNRELNSVLHIATIIKENSFLSDKNILYLAKVINKISKKRDIDPILLTAIIKYESSFNHLAISPKGAIGLMQILPTTAHYIAKKYNIPYNDTMDLFDSEKNIDLGSLYIKQLLKRFNGNIKLALIAYNWGPTNVLKYHRYGIKNPPKTSQIYASNIIGKLKNWQNITFIY